MSTLDLLREVEEEEEEEERRPYFIKVSQIPLRPFLTCRLHLPCGEADYLPPSKSLFLVRAAGTLFDDKELLTSGLDTHPAQLVRLTKCRASKQAAAECSTQAQHVAYKHTVRVRPALPRS